MKSPLTNFTIMLMFAKIYKGTFRDGLTYFNAFEKCGIIYGGLVELIVNAMVDIEKPFIEWELK